MSSSLRFTDDGATSPARKTIRSAPPDVIVSVGSGDSVQEFECYRVVLSWASEYFDALLSSGMKEDKLGRIEFPDKDPEEFKLFYEFIKPSKIAEVKYDANIDMGNVFKLLPWFHQFEMGNHVEECDRILARDWEGWRGYCKSRSYWKNTNTKRANENATDLERKEKFGRAFHIIQLADKYGLQSTRAHVGEDMPDLLSDDLLDFPVFKFLLHMVLPLRLVPVDESGNESEQIELMMLAGGKGCKEMWHAFREIISPHVSSLSQEILDNSATFPLLVYSFLQIKLEKEKFQAAEKHYEELRKSGTSIINYAMRYPNTIFHELPSSRSISSGGIDTFGEKIMQEIISEHYAHQSEDFKRFGITPP